MLDRLSPFAIRAIHSVEISSTDQQLVKFSLIFNSQISIGNFVSYNIVNMTAEAGQVKLQNFREASLHAKHSLQGLSPEVGVQGVLTLPVSPEMHDYTFQLQSQVEKEGDMDYHKYAAEMWGHVTGEKDGGDGFSAFESAMIRGLHGINMQELVEPSLTSSMPDLVATYKDDIASIAIWSTGDVAATGYQAGKIDNSQILRHFMHSIPKEERGRFVREKTAYMVADNKFDRLSEYAQSALEKNPDGHLKLVVIEDSVGNFSKVRKALDEKLGNKGGQVEVVPVWFSASREGRNARAKVEALKQYGDTVGYEKAREELDAQREALHAIDSFDELLDKERFGDIFMDGHVFVDFDGVIGDNIRMRDAQAKVIYNSLLQGMSVKTGKAPEELVGYIEEVITRIDASTAPRG